MRYKVKSDCWSPVINKSATKISPHVPADIVNRKSIRDKAIYSFEIRINGTRTIKRDIYLNSGYELCLTDGKKPRQHLRNKDLENEFRQALNVEICVL